MQKKINIDYESLFENIRDIIETHLLVVVVTLSYLFILMR